MYGSSTLRGGTTVTANGRPAVVAAPAREDDLDQAVLVRYLDGERERVLIREFELEEATA